MTAAERPSLPPIEDVLWRLDLLQSVAKTLTIPRERSLVCDLLATTVAVVAGAHPRMERPRIHLPPAVEKVAPLPLVEQVLGHIHETRRLLGVQNG